MVWVSIIGMTLDIIGFLILAREWFTTWVLQQALLSHEAGRAGTWTEDNYGPVYLAKDPKTKQFILPGSKKAAHANEKVLVSLKRAQMHDSSVLFSLGVVLVVAGYVLQIIGTWPR